ncbi:MAG: hypothetical protein ABIE42_09215 [Candidatus Eisenbacteria bacterium]
MSFPLRSRGQRGLALAALGKFPTIRLVNSMLNVPPCEVVLEVNETRYRYDFGYDCDVAWSVAAGADSRNPRVQVAALNRARKYLVKRRS